MLRRCRSLRIAYQFGSTTPSLFSLRTPTATTSAFLDSARYRLLRMNSSITVQTSNHDRQRRQDKEVKPIYFGPFEVTSQVFYATPHSFALVNLKPLLPGHVLVCPRQRHLRLTELSPIELADLFTTVQHIQRMLARHYFTTASPVESPTPSPPTAYSPEYLGSFNIALQDGPEAGQTVAHVHVHIIPRIRGSTAKQTATPSDELYDRMAEEDGNVGGWQWDLHHARAAELSGRPRPGGGFPRIEDCDRAPRSMEEMEKEAEAFKGVLRDMDEEEERKKELKGEVDSVMAF